MANDEGRANERTPTIDLLVFSAVGRGDVLNRTVNWLRQGQLSFAAHARKILALDGWDEAVFRSGVYSFFDRLVITPRRSGYVSNALQAIPAIESEFVWWMEDDWTLEGAPDWAEVLEAFRKEPRLAQIRWPKSPALLHEEKTAGRLTENVWIQDSFFSLNPHIGAAEAVRLLFEPGALSRKGTHFEVALSERLRELGLVAGCLAPEKYRAHHLVGRSTAGDGYEWQSTERSPSPAPEARSPQLGPRRVLDVASRTYGEGPLRSRAMLELAGKALFGLTVSLLSTVVWPFNRDARSFLRTTWRYWIPRPGSPEYLGPSRPSAHGS